MLRNARFKNVNNIIKFCSLQTLLFAMGEGTTQLVAKTSLVKISRLE